MKDDTQIEKFKTLEELGRKIKDTRDYAKMHGVSFAAVAGFELDGNLNYIHSGFGPIKEVLVLLGFLTARTAEQEVKIEGGKLK